MVRELFGLFYIRENLQRVAKIAINLVGWDRSNTQATSAQRVIFCNDNSAVMMKLPG